MPYVLSPMIDLNSPGMWMEGPAYEKRSIYSIDGAKLPPVNYDEHILRPHSLTHVETPAHTLKNGATLETFGMEYFHGKTQVIRLKGNRYRDIGSGLLHWVIGPEELPKILAPKVLVTTDEVPLNAQGFHDPTYVLTLSQKAADYLVSIPGFNLYGTSWKSSDFAPGSPERPIHNTLFKRALILENLRLEHVPEGLYFMSAFPLPLNGASEAPVVPVLYRREELLIDL